MQTKHIYILVALMTLLLILLVINALNVQAAPIPYRYLLL